jgi:DNA modification methylase
MYPLQFPYAKIARRPGAKVLDPFCGRGTTNFAARLNGSDSYGIDSNPVAAAVALAKLTRTMPEDVKAACKVAIRPNDAAIIPTGNFWSLCYHSRTLREICNIRAYLTAKPSLSAAEIVLRAVVLGILHGPKMKKVPTYLSNQMPRTYATKPDSAVKYWRREKMTAEYVDTEVAVARRADYLLKEQPEYCNGKVILGDSRNNNAFEGIEGIDLVVTSPPYLGMRTYWPDQWLRNWFMGGPSQVEYTKAEQITTQDIVKFTSDLAKVWKNTAAVCVPKARLIIRFGALPSYEVNPAELIKKTLKESDAGWVVKTSQDAGVASAGRRQADQFSKEESTPLNEVDVHCHLVP